MAAAAPRERPNRPDWRPSSPLARSVAGSLRQERLTVLRDEDKVSMTSLLTAGVMPLLGRRVADATAQRADEPAHTILPFPERRQRAEKASTEILVLFDAGRETSVELLKSRFESSVRAAGFPPSGVGRCLADHVEALSCTHRARFLFIIDGFDALLPATAVPAPAQRALIDEFVEMLNRPMPANLLLAVTSARWALATPLTARLQDIDPVVVSLAMPAMPGTAPSAPNLRLETPPDGRRSAAAEAFMRFGSGVPAASDWSETGDPFLPSDRDPLAPPVRPAPRRAAGSKKRAAALVGSGLLAVTAFAVWWQDAQRQSVKPVEVSLAARAQAVDPAPVIAPQPTGTLPVTAHPAPAPLPSAAPAAALSLRVDDEGHLSRRMLAELAQTLGERSDYRVEPRVVQGVSARLAGTSPSLAVASYDDLKRAAAGAQIHPVRVLASLGTEPIQVLVRSDSRLHYLHELEGKRIDVGPADGSRALTAALLYRKMFGAPMQAPQAVSTMAPEAVQRLLHDQGLDAVLMLGAQARTVLAALTEDERRALRPLTLQRDRDASRRAMQDYLPMTWTDADGKRVPGLASLFFLVATGTEDASETHRLDLFASSLCEQLGRLQRDGDPGWREVQAGGQLPIALQHVDTRVIDATWAGCRPEGQSASTTVER